MQPVSGCKADRDEPALVEYRKNRKYLPLKNAAFNPKYVGSIK
jgi:hypothetical protein